MTTTTAPKTAAPALSLNVEDLLSLTCGMLFTPAQLALERLDGEADVIRFIRRALGRRGWAAGTHYDEIAQRCDDAASALAGR